MKKLTQTLSAADVRAILDDKLAETGLDQVPKRLNLLDKILTSVDKLVGEVKGYRDEQSIVAGKISEHNDQLEDHDSRINRVEKHLNLPPS